MNKVILIPNPAKDEGLALTLEIVKKLRALGICVFISNKYSTVGLFGVEYYSDAPREADLLIVVGGDGSVIDASALAQQLDIPLLAVNLGKVGYLAELEPDSLELLDGLVRGEYGIEEKMLLSASHVRADGEVDMCEHLALNDVVISHGDYFGISDIMVENEQGDHVKYRADGVIVSTPAGSTAYSLSAGGPVISHTLDSVTVTPICPHSFFNRAIVYGPNEQIRISNIGNNVLNVSVDGRYFTRLDKGEACNIKRSERRLKMLTFTNSSVFTVLSKKIKHLSDI